MPKPNPGLNGSTESRLISQISLFSLLSSFSLTPCPHRLLARAWARHVVVCGLAPRCLSADCRRKRRNSPLLVPCSLVFGSGTVHVPVAGTRYCALCCDYGTVLAQLCLELRCQRSGPRWVQGRASRLLCPPGGWAWDSRRRTPFVEVRVNGLEDAQSVSTLADLTPYAPFLARHSDRTQYLLHEFTHKVWAHAVPLALNILQSSEVVPPEIIHEVAHDDRWPALDAGCLSAAEQHCMYSCL
jgi:hypothetical protein